MSNASSRRRSRVEVLARGVAQVVQRARRVGAHALARRLLAVHQPQRILRQASLAIRAQLVGLRCEKGHQGGAEFWPRLGVPERVDVQREVRDPERAERAPDQVDHLGVHRRAGVAQGFGADLVVLAQAPRLRPVIAEYRQHVEQLHRLRQHVHPVLLVGAHDGRRALGPQCERVAATVIEGVHLLLHDVRARAGALVEQLGCFERWRADGLVVAQPALARERARHDLPGGRVRGQPVGRAPRPLQAGARHRRSAVHRLGGRRPSARLGVKPLDGGLNAFRGNAGNSDALLAAPSPARDGDAAPRHVQCSRQQRLDGRVGAAVDRSGLHPRDQTAVGITREAFGAGVGLCPHAQDHGRRRRHRYWSCARGVGLGGKHGIALLQRERHDHLPHNLDNQDRNQR